VVEAGPTVVVETLFFFFCLKLVDRLSSTKTNCLDVLLVGDVVDLVIVGDDSMNGCTTRWLTRLLNAAAVTDLCWAMSMEVSGERGAEPNVKFCCVGEETNVAVCERE